MPVSDYLQNVSGYFQKSGQFYYILVDQQGYCVEANPLFRTMVAAQPMAFAAIPIQNFLSESGNVKYKQAAQFCLENPEKSTFICLDVIGVNTTNTINWEFSAITNHGDDTKLISGVGVLDTGSKSVGARTGEIIGRAAERNKAYELSAEGLWMFETEESVSVNLPTDAIINFWEQHAVLTECNENIAKMYGFNTAEEVIGMRLNKFIDFKNSIWIDSLKNFIQNGFNASKVETVEFDKDNKELFFLNNMKGVVENGLLKRVWGTQHDITQQRTAEKQLKQSELFYRNLIAHSLDGVILTNDDGVITFASPSIKEILGYEANEVIGKTTFDFAHPDDHALATSAFNDELRQQPKNKFVWLRLQKKTGEWIWCIVRGHNLKHNPYVGKMMVYFYDDTMRKQAEDALRQSEQRFHHQAIILNNVTDVIVTTDVNRIVTSWNNVIEKLTGITKEEAIGKRFREVLVSDYSPYTHDQVAEIVFKEGIWRGEISFEGSDGEMKYLLHTVSLFRDEEGNIIGLLGVGKDITERKKAEAKLQESELFYRNMISYSLDGIVMTDKNGKVVYCGPSVAKISGYEPAQLLGRSFTDFIHPDDLAAATEAFSLELVKKSVLKYLLIRLRHSNGEWIWCSVRGHNLLSNPGVNAVVIYFTNDSKRKDIEDKLRENEKQFRSLIQNLRQGILLQDEKGQTIICNRAAMDMLGLTEEQLFRQTSFDPIWNVIYEDGTNFPGHLHPVPVAIQTKKSVQDIVMGVFRPATNDRVWLLVNAEPVFDEQQNIVNVICSFTDITEQKRLSQELVEQEVHKQKQITQATIDGQEKERQQIGKELHDNINQHLTTTRLYLEVAKEKASGELKEMIDQSHKNLVSIINEIRHLSQSLVPPTLGDLGLIESIQELCDSLKRVHTFKIEFLYRYFNEQLLADNLKLMLFRITQEQINNIIRHAEADTIQIWLQLDAEHIILTVIDNGKGFNSSTTKKGQGFNNITNRAALFNGKVEVETTPGNGCKLTVVVPVREN